MADSDFVQTVSADPSGFLSAMQKAQASAKESAQQIQSAWDEVGAKFKAVQGIVGTMLAVLAGGAAFKSVIDQTVAWGTETGKLSRQLQVTTTEATAFQVASQRLGIESGTLLNASDKMARQLNKNETAFKTLGVETRNANGSWRSTGEMLPEVIEKLRGIDNATQQNIAGQQLFGKGWGELRPLLKLTAEEMEHARQKVKDLNLEVDPKAARSYKEALDDVKLIGTSLSIQMGNALLPVLTKLGKFMGEEGPVMGKTFGLVLETVSATAQALWVSIKDLGDSLGALAAMVVAAATGNFSGMKAIWDARTTEAEKNKEKLKSIWADVGKPVAKNDAPIEKGDGGQFIDFEKAKKAKENILALWEAQLAERKLVLQETAEAEGRFAEMSKEDERAFWQAKLALTKDGSTEQISIRKKLADLGLAIMQAQYATEIAALQAQQQAYKTNLDARRVLIEQEATLVAQKYGEASKEYQAVQAKLVALAREGSAQRLQVEEITQTRLRAIALAKIDADKADLDLLSELGKIDRAQFLQAEQQLEDKRYEITSKALQDRLQLLLLDPDRNPVAIAQLNAQIEQLMLQHKQKLHEIGNAAVLENNRIAITLIGGIEGQFVQLGQSLLTNWKNIGAALKNTLMGIGQMIITETIIKPQAAKLAAWVKDRILDTGEVESKAVVAGSGAAASQASIPYIGPVLAIAAMAAMLGAVRANKGSIPSAFSGWEVPRDTLAMVHEQEMILPASISQPLKAQLADGGMGGGGGTVHIHGKPDDSVRLRDLAALLKKMNRNFEFV